MTDDNWESWGRGYGDFKGYGVLWLIIYEHSDWQIEIFRLREFVGERDTRDLSPVRPRCGRIISRLML